MFLKIIERGLSTFFLYFIAPFPNFCISIRIYFIQITMLLFMLCYIMFMSPSTALWDLFKTFAHWEGTVITPSF